MADLPFSRPYLQSLKRIFFLFSGFAFFQAESSLWVEIPTIPEQQLVPLLLNKACSCCLLVRGPRLKETSTTS